VILIYEESSLPETINENVLKDKKIDIILNKKIIEVNGDNYKVTSIVIQDIDTNDVSEIKTSYIFVNKGYSAAVNFIESLDIVSDGIIKVNENKCTKLPGIFAAGDVIKNDNKQIVAAINDGTIAAMNAIKFVNEE
jgi:thioredoxin reductase (NADPH)